MCPVCNCFFKSPGETHACRKKVTTRLSALPPQGQGQGQKSQGQGQGQGQSEEPTASPDGPSVPLNNGFSEDVKPDIAGFHSSAAVTGVRLPETETADSPGVDGADRLVSETESASSRRPSILAEAETSHVKMSFIRSKVGHSKIYVCHLCGKEFGNKRLRLQT